MNFWEKSPVMGILNVTPDSFSDGGTHMGEAAAVSHALKMVEEGAGCIDVGGESTRPGFVPVPVEEELNRVIPVVRALVRELGDRIPVSVDSTKPEVIRRSLEEGAAVVNDVSGMASLEAMCEALRGFSPWYVLMHSGKDEAPTVEGIGRWFLRVRDEACARTGVSESRFILDAGVGFHRGAEDDVALMRMTPELKRLGASRKSFLGKVTGRSVGERLVGSVSAAALCRYLGADIIRVHDVAASVDACRVADAFS